MAKILIIEDDAVFAAVLEDRLHVAGHSVESTADMELALRLTSAGGIALVILKLELPGSVSGIEALKSLRAGKSPRTLPIIALSTQTEALDRVAVLRAGADELLNQPGDLEELLIRVGRLLGSDEASPSVMQGDLGNHPTWELMQFIQQAGKTGQLVIRGPHGTGHVRLVGGRVDSARISKLAGRNALLALLDLKEGHFHLTTEEVADAQAGAPKTGIPIPEVLMAFAWLEDELKKRQEHLPETGVPLETKAADLPAPDSELSEVPIEAVFQRLKRSSGRLFDLIAEGLGAPSQVRLAVAWLVEQGAVAKIAGPPEQFMTTTEISSTMVLDVAIYNLLRGAHQAGFDPNSLPYLLVIEEAVWPQLQELLERVPGFRRLQSLHKLIEQVKLRQGGSATFESEQGSLSLHVQILSPEVQAKVEAIFPVCAGVLLWLDEGRDRALVKDLLGRLEGVRSKATGVLVAHRAEHRDAIMELVVGHERWQASRHAPQSLIGILRLLHPRS